jgi:hypothetical protein
MSVLLPCCSGIPGALELACILLLDHMAVILLLDRLSESSILAAADQIEVHPGPGRQIVTIPPCS